jgi:FkbM family methyltransferase
MKINKKIKNIIKIILIIPLIKIHNNYQKYRYKLIKKKQEKEDCKRRKQFYESFIRKNDLCFDVGANMGNRVEPLLELGAKIVAVEPQEHCYTYLKKKFGNKIRIVTKGLGENEEVKKLFIADQHQISSFSTEWIESVKTSRFKDYNWNKNIDIEMTTVDKLIEIYGLPEFIKIDVEGYEHEVLKGLTKPVGMISFEYTVPEQTDKVIKCIEQIESIAPNIECNYSIGESMVFALSEWCLPGKMKEFIHTHDFIVSGFGDVYIKTKN